MRALIIYFTGTGTTAAFAEMIAGELRRRQVEVTMKRMRDLSPADLVGYDIVGFGAPAYSFRAPRVCTSWLRGLPPGPGRFFAFGTAGSNDGNLLWSIAKPFLQRGWTCLGGIAAYGTNNLRAWRPAMDSPSATTLTALLPDTPERAAAFVSNLMRNAETGASEPIGRKILWSVLTVFASHRWQMAMLVAGKTANPEICTKCGLCATMICPVGAITLDSAGFPHFAQGKCVGCSGCVNLCPVLAIDTPSLRKKSVLTTYQRQVLRPPE
jgi:flavodoxin/ferredoxin